MQKRQTTAFGDRFQASAKRRIAAGAGKEAARQRAIVEAGAAGQNRDQPARMDRSDRRGGVARVLGGRVFVGWIRDVDQMVWNTAPLRERQLVGPDVEPAVDGGRVAVDDFPAVPLGDGQRQRALPRRGRAENGDDETRSHCRALPHAQEHVRDEGDQQDHEAELLRPRHERVLSWGRFVIEERDGEEGLVGRVLRRERLRRDWSRPARRRRHC